MASSIFPLMQKFLDDEWVKLDGNQITPWAFFNSAEPFQVKTFHGKPIACSGIKFSVSDREIFWGKYIQPFIEDIANRAFDESLRLSKDRQIYAKEPLYETSGLLFSLARKAFRRMVTIDQRLRGGGLPESVAPMNVDHELGELEAFISRRLQSEISTLQSHLSWRLRKFHDGHPFVPWMIAALIAAFGSTVALLNYLK